MTNRSPSSSPFAASRFRCTLVALAAAGMLMSLSTAHAADERGQEGIQDTGTEGRRDSNKSDEKDIVVDAPIPAAAPVTTAPATSTGVAATTAAPPSVRPAPAVSGPTVASLNELALALLRAQQSGPGPERAARAAGNLAVSPVSLMSAMGMVHAGTTGAGAQEIAGLLGATSANSKAFTVRWPQAYRAIADTGVQSGQLGMASRIWVDQAVATSLDAGYARLISQRYAAQGAALPFSDAERARRVINQWVDGATASRIPELLPQGSIKANTRMVVTNAVYFRAPWMQPFDKALTQPTAFTLPDGSSKNVPTMHAQRSVKTAEIDRITVYELPFAGSSFVLRIAMPPKGHTLQAMLEDQDGTDMGNWGAQLKPTPCRLSLPRFRLAAGTQSLKPALQSLGVKTVFGQEADFSPLLGRAGAGLHVDNVYQSVMVAIDETGGEATAATAATIQAKSFSPAAQLCKVDRPFLFSIVHQASQVPVFMGQVTDPTQP